MRTLSRDTESPLARRCAQVCTISLAAFVCSGIGLLIYLATGTVPPWLNALAMAAGVTAAAAFAGWLIVSLHAALRG